MFSVCAYGEELLILCLSSAPLPFNKDVSTFSCSPVTGFEGLVVLIVYFEVNDT